MNICLDQMGKGGPLGMPANAENPGMSAIQSLAGTSIKFDLRPFLALCEICAFARVWLGIVSMNDSQLE